jgi:hypothetical protein
MASLKDLTDGMAPVVGFPKTIQFGPVSLDGYMLENGEFRQSITSTELALGSGASKTIHRMLVPRYAGSATPMLRAGNQNPVVPTDFSERTGENGEKGRQSMPIVVPVITPGVVGGSTAYTINLAMAVEGWKQVAIGGGKYAHAALELLGLCAIHSLERAYQEAFGVTDIRSTNDRLLEWAIRLDPANHFPLFAGEFHKHFARVTGVTIGHRYARVCLAELVYHRLPEQIYESLKDLNPEDERGWRQFSHSQLMTDEMRNEMRGIVLTVTNQLANTPSKADDRKAYRKLLQRLDKTLPRYRTRKNHARVVLEAAND